MGKERPRSDSWTFFYHCRILFIHTLQTKNWNYLMRHSLNAFELFTHFKDRQIFVNIFVRFLPTEELTGSGRSSRLCQVWEVRLHHVRVCHTCPGGQVNSDRYEHSWAVYRFWMERPALSSERSQAAPCASMSHLPLQSSQLWQVWGAYRFWTERPALSSVRS